ncbi:hypothetical protein PUN28_002856 [Cardiocondyla obscurior]|uniref:Uncharacterized protein n=1 Tax=Cardiocondyla obscurior TaxID=286306 RepID=A0AAW2GWR2_9HYME
MIASLCLIYAMYLGPNGIIIPGTLYENYILNVFQEFRSDFHYFGLSASTCSIIVTFYIK